MRRSQKTRALGIASILVAGFAFNQPAYCQSGQATPPAGSGRTQAVLAQLLGHPVPKDARNERPVGPGVVHLHETLTSGPLSIDVLKVDLSNPSVHIETAEARDHLFASGTVGDIVQAETHAGHSVIGAVNADFFGLNSHGIFPIGLFVAEGFVYNLPGTRSVLAVTRQGEVYFGVLTMEVSLDLGGKKLPIAKLNDLDAPGEVVLYTPALGKELPASSGRLYFSLELEKPEFLPNAPARVKISRTATGTSVPLSTRNLVLGVPAGRKDLLQALSGAREALVQAQVPQLKGVVEWCVGGGPRIVRDGAVAVEYDQEKVGRNFATDRHPRTALGLSRDRKTFYLLTVDGRQPGLSVGMNLFEMAEYMRGLGCWEAINLDGGGSTTMIVRGEVVNHPSDASGPRKVANAVLVVSSAAQGPLAQLKIDPDPSTLVVPTATKLNLLAKGYDANFNPLPLASQPIKWQASALLGTLSSQGDHAQLQAADVPALGEVQLQGPGQIKTSAKLQVVDVDQIQVNPPVLVLSSQEKTQLRVSALAQGDSLKLQPQMLEITPSDDSLALSGLDVQARHQGQGRLRVRVGKAQTTVPYYVDRFKSQTLLSFDDLAPATTLSGTFYNAKRSGLAVETIKRKEGKASLAFSYAMVHGGVSKIGFPVSASLASAPSKLSLWVYGDAGQEWLRAELTDAAGQKFMMDFTKATKGVNWRGEWRQLLVPFDSAVPRSNPSARMEFPVTVNELYVAQDQDAIKGSGTLYLDGFQAIYPPQEGR